MAGCLGYFTNLIDLIEGTDNIVYPQKTLFKIFNLDFMRTCAEGENNRVVHSDWVGASSVGGERIHSRQNKEREVY